VRQHFYRDAVEAMQAALAAGRSRIRLRCIIPELNVETDVYRVGTLLEMVRDMATALAADGKKVKVCVQGAMGAGVFQGLPLSLSGVKRIMTSMDWGDAAEFVSIGAVGAAEVDDSDFYIMVAPQNVVGNTIMTSLGEHVQAAEEKGKSVVLVNPVLKDLPSHSGIMGVRGRAERMAFADSFDVAYHFRLLFLPGQWYPIMGALRYSYGKEWEVFKRADTGKKTEEYQLVGSFDHEPSGAEITACFKPKPQPVTPGRWW
jgi:adenylate kinase